jgi:hypothetical protein
VVANTAAARAKAPMDDRLLVFIFTFLFDTKLSVRY